MRTEKKRKNGFDEYKNASKVYQNEKGPIKKGSSKKGEQKNDGGTVLVRKR